MRSFAPLRMTGPWCLALFAMFTPPDADQRRRAIGDTHSLPPALQRALDPAAFELIGEPGASDWLANHPESGQTFDDFVHSHPNRPNAQRRTIYLQPLGTFDIGPLREFTAAFFMMPVVVRPPLDLATANITSRNNPNSGQRQLLTTDILAFLRRNLPPDAYTNGTNTSASFALINGWQMDGMLGMDPSKVSRREMLAVSAGSSSLTVATWELSSSRFIRKAREDTAPPQILATAVERCRR